MRCFDRPSGQNQGSSIRLPRRTPTFRPAKQFTFDAALGTGRRQTGEAIGAQANTAKYLAAEAAFEAADVAVQAHGGCGVAREYDVERYFREARLTRLVPITQELALNYMGEQRARTSAVVLTMPGNDYTSRTTTLDTGKPSNDAKDYHDFTDRTYIHT